jgi:hypothetical protein
MPMLGDPASCLDDTSVVAAAIPEMETRRLHTYLHVLWSSAFCRGQGEPKLEEVEKVLCDYFGVQKGDIKVSRHRPKNFLANFKYPHHQDAVMALEGLPMGSLDSRI